MTVYRNLAFGLKERHTPKPEIDRRVPRWQRDPRPGRPAEAPPGAALRRAAPARGDGSRARARAEGVPAGRAALEPRREAPRADARRAEAHPPAPRHHDDVRHARPGRGDDARRPHRGDVGGRGPADRSPAGGVPPSRQPVRGGVHRQPADEPAAGRRLGRRSWSRANCRSPGAGSPDGEVAVGIRPECADARATTAGRRSSSAWKSSSRWATRSWSTGTVAGTPVQSGAEEERGDPAAGRGGAGAA